MLSDLFLVNVNKLFLVTVYSRNSRVRYRTLQSILNICAWY